MRDCTGVRAVFIGMLAVLPTSVLAGTEIYVPLGSANAIAVVDADTDRVSAEIPGINASHGLAVSMDGNLLLAGSLLERPKGVAPVKPTEMSEADHAAHHSRGNQSAPVNTPKAETVGTAI